MILLKGLLLGAAAKGLPATVLPQLGRPLLQPVW
jgi:hypothetical protein